MKFQKIAGFLRHNLLFYSIGSLILLGMKYFYSQADAGNLRWILGPTARWVETLSGIPFVYEPGMGYANHGLRFLIAPSCSGVQFMIITAALLIFSFSHRVGSRRTGERSGNSKAADARAESRHLGDSVSSDASAAENAVKEKSGADRRRQWTLPRTVPGLCWIAASLLLSYLFTIFVNGLRIVAAIFLPYFFERAGVFKGALTPDRLHTMIGAVVYFASLLTIYRLAGLFFSGKDGTAESRPLLRIVRGCLSPVFWYFFIVLGIPFLNRAYGRNEGQFTEFALLVTLCCGSVLLLYCLGAAIRRRLRGRR